MEERLCVTCKKVIPARRVEALPDTLTCMNCSSISRKVIRDLPGAATVQHTGGLHEKYMKEEDI